MKPTTRRREREESRFKTDGFEYRSNTGEIWKDGARRDYRDGLYRSVCNGGIRVLAHRLAWRLQTGQWPENLVDHRNLNKQDNCFDNLRDATRSENEFNKPANKNGLSGERGVYFDSCLCRWKIGITANGNRFVAYASHKISAILAARLIRRELHGDFAFCHPRTYLANSTKGK